MGMFDEIEFSCDCPTCGDKVSDFQSKDGPCELLKLKPLQVSNFYAICRNCKTWIEYRRLASMPDLQEFGSMDHFRLKIEKP